MKKINVLVFPCGSEIGLEVYRSLQYSTHFKVYGSSTVHDHGEVVYENYIHGLPHVDSPDFTEKLNKLINDYNISLIIPAHDSLVVKLADLKERGQLDCEVVTSCFETCNITRSKLKTYEYFKDTVRTPRMFSRDSLKPDDFPVFLKPEVGQGSRGTYLATQQEEVDFYLKKDSSLLILENLPGKEFTVDCFTDMTGKLRFYMPRERVRIQNGISVRSKTVQKDRFKEFAKQINSTLSLRGAWFFQVKEDKHGHLVLMEIAPRIAGTMGLTRVKGVNLVLLSLFDALGRSTVINPNSYAVVIDRALENKYIMDLNYSHVYLDYDDTCILNGNLNTLVIAFVYQCIGRGIQVHLLTRHDDNLDASLRKYRLQNVFDEIVWLKEGESKAAHIQHKDSIFIDDSFQERYHVQEQLHIPVFDVHMLECLIKNLKEARSYE